MRGRSLPSLRGAKRRSNPESLCGKILDCFATLAMTTERAYAGVTSPSAARWPSRCAGAAGGRSPAIRRRAALPARCRGSA
ncbi:hypothetical protein DCG74_34470 [Bradyrhizobium sp. WBAH42]|nr:hypothetical protein DCG74_34470 [Bradyrhizobium sp. WBAH42]